MTEEEQLLAAMAAIGAQRGVLGDAVVEVALAPMREKLEALRARSRPSEQRRQVTVLFADLSGFTAMAEAMDPEELRELVDRLWRQFDAVITAHGGMIDKHIGDAVMALWGAGTPREDDAEQAVRAGLALQDELARLRESMPKASAIGMRVGINTGLVSLGEVGTKAEFTAMGGTVNLASRLEQAALVGSVLIAHDTYRHVQHAFHFTPLAPLTLKGRVEPIKAYSVNRADSSAPPLRSYGRGELGAPCVGRTLERQRIEQSFAAACRGHLQMLLITAEPGLGKTRLLSEFRAALSIEPARARLLVGACNEASATKPFGVLYKLLANEFAIGKTDPPQLAREKFVSACGLLWQDDPDATAKAELLGHALGFDFSTSARLRMALEAGAPLRERAHAALAELLIAMTHSAPDARAPVVMLLEDIHYADDATLDALAHICTACAHLPLLILATSRPSLLERRPTLAEPQNLLSLQPLTSDAMELLIDHLLAGADVIPAELRTLLLDHAQGIPFYVEELFKLLIDEGVIVPEGHKLRIDVARLPAITVPATLKGALEIRLEALPEKQRSVLKRAAVAGRTFTDRMVATLHREHEAPMSIGEVRTCLQELVNREILVEKGTDATGEYRDYRFAHALMRDVAYDALLLKERRPLHSQVAHWLVARRAHGVPLDPAAIAEHFALAGDPALCAEWYDQAGREALAASRPDSALFFFEQTLAQIDGVSGVDEQERGFVRKQLALLRDGSEDAPEASRALPGLSELSLRLGALVAQAIALRAATHSERRGRDSKWSLHPPASSARPRSTGHSRSLKRKPEHSSG